MQDETRPDACSKCPFRRNSLPGYLGASSYQLREFLVQPYHIYIGMPCHMDVDWEQYPIKLDHARHCRGYKQRAEMVRQVEPDPERFFANQQEFIEHHRWKGHRD